MIFLTMMMRMMMKRLRMKTWQRRPWWWWCHRMIYMYIYEDIPFFWNNLNLGMKQQLNSDENENRWQWWKRVTLWGSTCQGILVLIFGEKLLWQMVIKYRWLTLFSYLLHIFKNNQGGNFWLISKISNYQIGFLIQWFKYCAWI